MKRKPSTEEQIGLVVRQAEAGTPIGDLGGPSERTSHYEGLSRANPRYA